MSLNILGVHHIAIQVDDLDAARRFYREVMGLAEIADRPDFDVDGASFQLGAHELHLGVEDGHTAAQRQHFAVEVSNLDVAVGAIKSLPRDPLSALSVPLRDSRVGCPRLEHVARS